MRIPSSSKTKPSSSKPQMPQDIFVRSEQMAVKSFLIGRLRAERLSTTTSVVKSPEARRMSTERTIPPSEKKSPTEAELLIYVITLGSRQENIIVQLTNIEFYPNETRAIKHFPHTIFKTSTSYLNHNQATKAPYPLPPSNPPRHKDEYPSKPQLAVDRNLPPPNNTTSNNQKQHSSPPPNRKNPPRNIILSRGGTMMAATYSLTY